MDVIDRDMTIHELEAFRESCIANLLRMSFDDITDVVNGIPAVNRWIPCSEMLPEIDRDVLVYYPYWKDNPIQVAHLEYESMYFELSDGEYNLPVNAVTHWMHLPERPESEAQHD